MVARMNWGPTSPPPRGAYLIRDFAPGKPKHGTVLVTGTPTTANIVKLLPHLAADESEGPGADTGHGNG